jgi:CheY-like chemotaxis protein
VAIITNATRSIPREHEEERAHAVVQCAVHPQRTPLPILLIEDSDEDHAALVRALDGIPVLASVHRCTRADEALDYLHGRGRFADPARAPRPALVLLDLNLPDKDGRAVLTEIRGDERLRAIPVVIVSSSKRERDVMWCYEHGANGYHVKAVDYPRFRDEMRLLVAYWLSVCVLPANAEERPGG